MTTPRLIALDWGTSNLRASLLADAGTVLDARAAASGVMAVGPGGHAQALDALCGDWIDGHRCPAIASGMVGSLQGWQEAPYIGCPAGLADAAARLTRVALRPGIDLHIVPGLHCTGSDGNDDVMRGEETQLWGAALPPDSCCVLPGTHSKWAWMGAGGAVTSFETFMTGELFALLTQHGILGRLMAFGGADAAAFAHGVRQGLAEHRKLPHLLFSARTAGLMDRFAPAALPDLLSGQLIGAEIAGATLTLRPAQVALLGERALCDRYDAALAIAGIASRRVADGATTRGQWQVAVQAGLLERSDER